jgi:hypothetical protein
MTAKRNDGFSLMTVTFSGQMTMRNAAGKMTLSLIDLHRLQQDGGFVR